MGFVVQITVAFPASLCINTTHVLQTKRIVKPLFDFAKINLLQTVQTNLSFRLLVAKGNRILFFVCCLASSTCKGRAWIGRTRAIVVGQYCWRCTGLVVRCCVLFAQTPFLCHFLSHYYSGPLFCTHMSPVLCVCVCVVMMITRWKGLGTFLNIKQSAPLLTGILITSWLRWKEG